MKVYISGPITGTTDYMERFAEAERRLYEKYGSEVSVVNPAKVNSQLPQDTTYEEYMKLCLVMLDMCDAICMIRGWRKSNGANRELGYALGKKYRVLYEQFSFSQEGAEADG